LTRNGLICIIKLVKICQILKEFRFKNTDTRNLPTLMYTHRGPVDMRRLFSSLTEVMYIKKE
jgi:hypothetical protein